MQGSAVALRRGCWFRIQFMMFCFQSICRNFTHCRSHICCFHILGSVRWSDLQVKLSQCLGGSALPGQIWSIHMKCKHSYIVWRVKLASLRAADFRRKGHSGQVVQALIQSQHWLWIRSSMMMTIGGCMHIQFLQARIACSAPGPTFFCSIIMVLSAFWRRQRSRHW